MRKFTKSQRLYLYKFCADMINAELPLYDSLLKLQKEGAILLGKGFSKKLMLLTEKMTNSTSIAAVFQDLIPRDELSVIYASERSGGLADGFLTLVNIINYNKELMKKLIQAMIFPVIMIVLALTVITGYAIKVFPAFAEVIPVTKWPAVTQVLFNFGDSMAHGLWITVLVSAIVTVLIVRFMLANVCGSLRNNMLDRILPFSTYKQIAASVFLNNLARMLKNKIPINDSLNIINLNSNRWLKSHINTMIEKMSSGVQYGVALNTGLFGPEELLNISLYSGLPSFNEVLTSVSDKSKENIMAYIQKLAGMLKSLSTLVLGGCVVWVFIALYALSDALSTMTKF